MEDKTAQELIKKYNIPVKTTSSSTITNFDVLRESGPNKRVTVIRDADGEIMCVSERDLILDIF